MDGSQSKRTISYDYDAVLEVAGGPRGARTIRSSTH
jgi:hypothetical protein